VLMFSTDTVFNLSCDESDFNTHERWLPSSVNEFTIVSMPSCLLTKTVSTSTSTSLPIY
jgi:hypothetical protein